MDRALKQLEENLVAVRKLFLEARQRLEEECQRIMHPMQELWRQCKPGLEALAKLIAEVYKNLPENTRRDLANLAEHGWYVDSLMTIPDLDKISAAFEGGDIQAAEQELVEHYRSRAQAIEECLCTKFPRRASILREAFAAHARGSYCMSIPVFLIQADGICDEITGFQLYRKQKIDGMPETAEYVRQLAENSFTEALLHPLTIKTPMTASFRQQKKDEDVLNRHQILHGVSIEYGTERNSLKAISLLNYVAWILRD
jgi:hypothetical protein